MIAHASDLHASDFGDTFHDVRRVVKRSARVADTDPTRWEVYWQESGWRVLHKRGARRAKIQVRLQQPPLKLATSLLHERLQLAVWRP